MEQVEDNELMLAVKAGDLDDLGLLFRKYHGPLIGYFRRMCGDAQLSEDLAQETFWRILRYRNSFDAKRPFRAWMYQIARNLMYDQFKKKQSAQRVFDERVEWDSESFPEAGVDVGGAVERADGKELLRAALARLPIEKRELIVMCRFEELPYSEIAVNFGCTVGTLKVRLFRALQELKSVFEEMGGKQPV